MLLSDYPACESGGFNKWRTNLFLEKKFWGETLYVMGRGHSCFVRSCEKISRPKRVQKNVNYA
jgi:hypothetical protein